MLRLIYLFVGLVLVTVSLMMTSCVRKVKEGREKHLACTNGREYNKLEATFAVKSEGVIRSQLEERFAFVCKKITSVFKFAVTDEDRRSSASKEDEYWACWKNSDR